MTEQPTTRKANARKPKPFGPDLTDAMIFDRRINELLGAAAHIRQFNVAAMAATKAAATDVYTAAGLNSLANPRYLRTQQGDDIESLIDAGVLTDDGAVLVWERGGTGHAVVAVAPGRDPRVVAHFGDKIPGQYRFAVTPAEPAIGGEGVAPPDQRQRDLDIAVLEQVRDQLPHGNADKAGIIRAIEVLRHEPLDPFESDTSRGTADDTDREQS